MNSEQNEQRSRSNGNGSLLGCLIVVALILALVVGGLGGAMLDGPQLQRAVTIYPDIPIDTSTLNVQPAGAVFKEAPTPVVVYQAAQSTPVVVPFVVQGCVLPDGWRVGVSALPDCWASMSRQDQNAAIEASQ